MLFLLFGLFDGCCSAGFSRGLVSSARCGCGTTALFALSCAIVASAIHIQRKQLGVECRKLFGVQVAYQFHVLNIFYSSALIAYQMNVLHLAVDKLEYCMVGEQMTLHNATLHKQFKIAVDGGFAHFVMRLRHFVTQHLHIEMPVDGQYLIQYSKAFGRPAATLALQKPFELLS